MATTGSLVLSAWAGICISVRALALARLNLKPGKKPLQSGLLIEFLLPLRKVLLQLTSPALVVLYVRTVFHFVFGRWTGNFLIVEHADEIPWASHASNAPRDMLTDSVMPLTYRGPYTAELHRLLVTVLLGDAVYRIEAIVSGEPGAGQIWLCDETLVAEGPPI